MNFVVVFEVLFLLLYWDFVAILIFLERYGNCLMGSWHGHGIRRRPLLRPTEPKLVPIVSKNARPTISTKPLKLLDFERSPPIRALSGVEEGGRGFGLDVTILKKNGGAFGVGR